MIKPKPEFARGASAEAASKTLRTQPEADTHADATEAGALDASDQEDVLIAAWRDRLLADTPPAAVDDTPKPELRVGPTAKVTRADPDSAGANKPKAKEPVKKAPSTKEASAPIASEPQPAKPKPQPAEPKPQTTPALPEARSDVAVKPASLDAPEAAEISAPEKPQQKKPAQLSVQEDGEPIIPVPPPAKAKAPASVANATPAETESQDVDTLLAGMLVTRRKQRTRLAAKLALFVLVPTLAVWYYVAHIAVPLFTATAVISVTKPAPEANTAGLGILGAVNGGGQMREAFMVLEFLRSPAAFEALENEVGLISYYKSDEMDPVGRVRDLEFLQISESQSLGRYVKSSINVQNGLISTSIRARSREDALTFLNTLLVAAEGHLNELSASLFSERMAQANGAVELAQDAVRDARTALVQVQIENGEIAPEATVAGIYEAINLLEIERLKLDRQILALEPFEDDGPAILQRNMTSRDEFTRLIDLQRERLVDKSNGRSLNEKLTAHQAAQASVLVAEQTLAAALAGRNEARQAAELGVTRFQVVVPPQAPEISVYPNRLQVTGLAFFLFLSALAVFSIMAPRSDQVRRV